MFADVLKTTKMKYIEIKSEGYFGLDYDKSKFDYIIDSKEKIDIKKMVKLL